MKKYVPITDPVAAAKEPRILKFFVENRCTRRHGIGYIDVQKVKSTASIVPQRVQDAAVQLHRSLLLRPPQIALKTTHAARPDPWRLSWLSGRAKR